MPVCWEEGLPRESRQLYWPLTLTEPFVFTESNFLYRGADVEGGETYTFSGDWDKSSEITVLVYGSTREQELTSVTENIL